MDKTNVMRILDQKNIDYTPREYDNAVTDGESVAKILGEDPDSVFKTLVTVSDKNENLVFVVPVNCSLNLKKAAKAANVKSVVMIKQKELFPLTGYVHGGCSPVGMKKQLRTFIEETAEVFDKICVSAGKVGFQVQINPEELKNIVNAQFSDLADGKN